MIMIILYQLFEPILNNKSHSQRYSRCFVEKGLKHINKMFKRLALQAIEFLSQWCRGRIKRTKKLKRRSPKSRRWRIIQSSLCITPIIMSQASQATPTTSRTMSSTPRFVNFATGDFSIGIDSRASSCMSNSLDDFVGKLETVQVNLKTYDQTKRVRLKQGTIQWTWSDSDGIKHTFNIRNCFYDPGGTRLLSPQHWASEVQHQKKLSKEEVYYYGNEDSFTLKWGHHKKTLALKENRVADIVAGNKKSAPLKQRDNYQVPSQDQLWCQQVAHVNEAYVRRDPSLRKNLVEIPRTITKLNLKEKEAPETKDLLWYHQRFGHISFRKLKKMSRAGILPATLQTQREPKCLYCIRAKATRRQWRGRATKNKERQELQPGEVVSVDQMTTDTPGYVAQMTGIPTVRRYTGATVFVDHRTRYTYVHLQMTMDADETIRGKELFEQKMQSFGHQVQAYHADNGVFAANK